MFIYQCYIIVQGYVNVSNFYNRFLANTDFIMYKLNVIQHLFYAFQLLLYVLLEYINTFYALPFVFYTLSKCACIMKSLH